MKSMIFATAMVAALALTACSSDDDTVEVKDWSTSTYFASTDAQSMDTYYKPSVGYVGDPMPFYDAKSGTFKILYLQDFRPNQTGTYHPIWGVETTDGSSYTSLGELIPCGGLKEQDAALGTGSTVYNDADGLYFTFYTGNKYQPTADECGEAVMMATSPDFKTWTKSRTFLLRGTDYGYSSSDFRDPFVFKGDDGQWHMIVSTTASNKGTLAEFVSADLKSWTSNGRFMNMMWDRFYECPDVFKMGDWWYLVYSEKHAAVRRVQYFKGKTLEQLKACTANDAGLWPDGHEGFLDSRALYAGKTASDGTNRYLWGWCPTRPGNDNTAVGAYPNEPEWAGNLVMHRLIQHADGSLTLGEVPALSTKYNKVQTLTVDSMSENVVRQGDNNFSLSGNSSILFSRLGSCNRISFTVKTTGNTDRFGLSLVRGSDSEKYYSIIVNPESDSRRKINFEQGGQKGIGFIAGADGYAFDRPADNTYNVTVYTDNSVCVVYVNDMASYTGRIYGIQKNCWSIDCYGGGIAVSNVEVRQY